MLYRIVLFLLILLLQAITSLDSYGCIASEGESAHARNGQGLTKHTGRGEQRCAQKSLSRFDPNDPKTKALNIAQKAAEEARAASDAQMTAAEAAATQVKQELAEKAAQSARIAEAALAGKQQMVEQLLNEIREADAVVTDISASLHSAQANANTAAQVATAAQAQLSQLKRMVNAATANLISMESVATGAQQELAEKSKLLEAAKNRVEDLNRQLNEAKQDFEKTKEAAYKAACAAVEARQKAARSRRMGGRW